MPTGYKEMLEKAYQAIKRISPEKAVEVYEKEDYTLVDLRDIRELTREGKIPGALHAPRGMIEFWIDPESPYHKPVFASGKQFVFYCNKGWRSALATHTAQQMGLNVCDIEGGFTAWKEAGHSVEKVER